MKAIAWAVGIVGVLIALAGIYKGMIGAQTVWLLGHLRAPSTFIIVGTFCLACAIWLAVLGPDKK